MVKTRIKNEKDHTLALSRIDQLLDAKPGTPEFDELELLSTLVEIYEEEHYPLDEPDPESMRQFFMEQRGIKS